MPAPNLSCSRDLSLVSGFSKFQDSWLSWALTSRCRVGKYRALALPWCLTPQCLYQQLYLCQVEHDNLLLFQHTEPQAWALMMLPCIPYFSTGAVMTCCWSFRVTPMSSVLLLSSLTICAINFLHYFHFLNSNLLIFSGLEYFGTFLLPSYTYNGDVCERTI